MPNFLTEAEISDFRGRFCAIAEREFLERGVEAVSMRSLAAAFGCSATTPYTYFRNKSEILAMVRALILNRLCERLEHTRCDDGLEWGIAQRKAIVNFAFDEPESYRLVYDLYQSDESEYREMVEANSRAAKVVTGYVERMIEQGYLAGDATELGDLFFAELHGLIGLRMNGRPPSSREEFDKKCWRYFKLIFEGVRPQRAAKASSSQKEPPRATSKKSNRNAVTGGDARPSPNTSVASKRTR